MNWVKKIVRVSKAKCASKNQRVGLRAGSLAPIHHTYPNPVDHLEDVLESSVIPFQTAEAKEITLKQSHQRMTESNGLLELTQPTQKINRATGLGDFDVVSQENFTHTLHFEKIDIDFADFNIDEMQTVCSQNIDLASLAGERQPQRFLEESEGSNVSYTESDIFIELPNSEIIGRSKIKSKNALNSAAF